MAQIILKQRQNAAQYHISMLGHFGVDHTKFGFYQFQSFLFVVVILISILLKITFSQISIHRKLLVKILQRSDKEKTTFKAIEKYRYGLGKTVLKHLKVTFTAITFFKKKRNNKRVVINLQALEYLLFQENSHVT